MVTSEMLTVKYLTHGMRLNDAVLLTHFCDLLGLDWIYWLAFECQSAMVDWKS